MKKAKSYHDFESGPCRAKSSNSTVVGKFRRDRCAKFRERTFFNRWFCVLWLCCCCRPVAGTPLRGSLNSSQAKQAPNRILCAAVGGALNKFHRVATFACRKIFPCSTSGEDGARSM